MDPIQSQLLLIYSERFGILLAENMDEVGIPLTVQTDNICKHEKIKFQSLIFIKQYSNCS